MFLLATEVIRHSSVLNYFRFYILLTTYLGTKLENFDFSQSRTKVYSVTTCMHEMHPKKPREGVRYVDIIALDHLDHIARDGLGQRPLNVC